MQKTFYHTHTTQLCSEEDKDKEEENNIKMGKGEAAALTKALKSSFSEEEEKRAAKQIRKAE